MAYHTDNPGDAPGGGSPGGGAPKRKPPPLPGDKGYTFRAFQKRGRGEPKAEETVDAAEKLMEDLGIASETGEPPGGAAPPGSPGTMPPEPPIAASPEAAIIAREVGISPEIAQTVWDAAQARDDLKGLSPEALAARLQTDFPLLTELMRSPEAEAAAAWEAKAPPPSGPSSSPLGGPEIEPEAEKEA